MLFSVQLVWPLVIACAWTMGAAAQDVPRWKFAEGDRLRYEVLQESDLEITAGKAGDTTSFVRQVLDVVWHVDQVDDAGTMTGTQRVERVRLLLRQPPGQEISFDSDSDEPAEALAAMLSPIFEVLLTMEVPITVTAAGQVTRCDVPEEMTKRIANMPTTKETREYSAALGVQTLAEQIALPLPAKSDEPGKRPLDVSLDVLGKMRADLAWAPQDTNEGLLRLNPRLEIAIESTDEPRKPTGFAQPHPLQSTTLESSEVTGEARFDMEQGRLESLQLELKLSMQGVLFGNQVNNQLRQQIRVTRKP